MIPFVTVVTALLLILNLHGIYSQVTIIKVLIEMCFATSNALFVFFLETLDFNTYLMFYRHETNKTLNK